MSVTTNSCDNERIAREIKGLQSRALCLQKQVCDLRVKKGCVESSIDRQRCGSMKQIECYLQKLQNIHSFLTSDMCQMNNVGLTSKVLMSDIERFMNTLKAEERRLQLAAWCRNVGACCPQVTCYPDLCPPPNPCDPCRPNPCDPCRPNPCDPCRPNPCNPCRPNPCDPCRPNPCDPCRPNPCDPCRPNPCDPCRPKCKLDCKPNCCPKISCCPDLCPPFDPCKPICLLPNPCNPCKPKCNPCKVVVDLCKPICPDPCDPCKFVCPDPCDPCKLLCATPNPCNPCKTVCLVRDPCNPCKLICSKQCPPYNPCDPFNLCSPCSPCLPCGPCPPCPPPCDPCPPCGPSFPCFPCPPCGPCPPCLPTPPCGPCYPCYDMPSTKCLDVVPHNVGRGGSAFFDQLCSDLWKCAYLPTSCPQETLACGTSWVRVIEVHQTGKYIKLVNTSCNKPEQIGGHYLIQQQMGGCPLAVFKFPPKVHFPPQATVKVWSCCNDPGLYKPPTDFVFKQLLRWSVGADISTLLCRPNGQAIAWLAGCNVLCKDPCSTVPAPWFSCVGASNVSTKKLR